MVLTLKRFPMCLIFLEIPLTYEMTVHLYIVSEEGQLLLDYFITEQTNSLGYSLLKSFWFWHITLAWLIKLWMTPLFMRYGWQGVFHSLISQAKVICQDQKDLNNEIKNIRHDLMLKEYPKEFIHSITNPLRRNRPSLDTIY
jgi:hypothetical protein